MNAKKTQVQRPNRSSLHGLCRPRPGVSPRPKAAAIQTGRTSKAPAVQISAPPPRPSAAIAGRSAGFPCPGSSGPKNRKGRCERYCIAERQDETALRIQCLSLTRKRGGQNRIERKNAWGECQQDAEADKSRKQKRHAPTRQEAIDDIATTCRRGGDGAGFADTAAGLVSVSAAFDHADCPPVGREKAGASETASVFGSMMRRAGG
ncbi:hypothetical protein DdX_21530 [Ditylenchus destructor]|uniref:Uncharacterized protein n=1 Tax=Ditylenchus destructor TaxID=166010 RepID=A0AAD4MFL0_9BILA|nr:hypothetical protein DdX_21530 [Ditylenchus destructor]